MTENVYDWYKLEQYKFRKLFDLVLKHNNFETIDEFWALFHDQTWQPIDEGWENAR